MKISCFHAINDFLLPEIKKSSSFEYQAPYLLDTTVYQCEFPLLSLDCVCLCVKYTACYLRSNRYTWGKKI